MTKPIPSPWIQALAQHPEIGVSVEQIYEEIAAGAHRGKNE